MGVRAMSVGWTTPTEAASSSGAMNLRCRYAIYNLWDSYISDDCNMAPAREFASERAGLNAAALSTEYRYDRTQMTI